MLGGGRGILSPESSGRYFEILRQAPPLLKEAAAEAAAGGNTSVCIDADVGIVGSLWWGSWR